jgi:hypothetical protein
MVRYLTMAMAMLATQAWAVGERVAIVGPDAEQLKEQLCISMECVSPKANPDAVISTRHAGAQTQLEVKAADGTLRLSRALPLNDSNRLSSMDQVSATASIVSAIETKAKVEAPKPAPAKKPAKLAKKSKSKKEKSGPIQLAARFRAR